MGVGSALPHVIHAFSEYLLVQTHDYNTMANTVLLKLNRVKYNFDMIP